MNYSEFNEYLSNPIYHASSNDVNFPFDFLILQSKLDTEEFSGTLNHFYFVDHLTNYNHLFPDQESVKIFNKNPRLAFFTIELFMAGETKENITSIEIDITKDSNDNYISTPLDKTKMKPLTLTYNYHENNTNYFRYITFKTTTDANGKESRETIWNNSQVIEKIEISFQDYTKATDNKPVTTKLITLTHNELATLNQSDTFTLNENNVYEANNFNGDINNYINLTGFTNSDETIILHNEALQAYNNIKNKWLIIYFFVALVATYLIFVLPKQVDRFKQKRMEKKYPAMAARKKKVAEKQIFKNE